MTWSEIRRIQQRKEIEKWVPYNRYRGPAPLSYTERITLAAIIVLISVLASYHISIWLMK